MTNIRYGWYVAAGWQRTTQPTRCVGCGKKPWNRFRKILGQQYDWGRVEILILKKWEILVGDSVDKEDEKQKPQIVGYLHTWVLQCQCFLYIQWCLQVCWQPSSVQSEVHRLSFLSWFGSRGETLVFFLRLVRREFLCYLEISSGESIVGILTTLRKKQVAWWAGAPFGKT